MAGKQETPNVSPEKTAGMAENKGESPAAGEISVSFLLTKEDYGEYCVAAVNRRISLRETMGIRILGLLAILCGFLFACLWSGNGWIFGWTACLELIGLVMLIWYDWILPTHVRVSACGYMDHHREELTSRTFVFTPSGFSYTNSGCSMEIPYGMLYGAFEGSRVFIFYMGAENSVYLPKRAVSEEDCREIRALLANALQEKFDQEGAR